MPPNITEDTELFRQAGLRADWAHEFVRESNKIDPQPGSSEPGTPLYDRHMEAVLYALKMAAEDRYALPKTIHEILMLGHPRAAELAGKNRTQEAKVGINQCLDPILVPQFIWSWNHRVREVIDSLRTDDDSIDPDDKIVPIWDLHCEFENIRPYEIFNGKVGRILMVNHALLVDVNPWIIPCELGREDYFDMIRYHESGKWGLNPPESYLVGSA